MKKTNNKPFDKSILYILALICPFLALSANVIIDHNMNNDSAKSVAIEKITEQNLEDTINDSAVRLPSMIYNDIHFIADEILFLSEGNHYLPPDMTEGIYEERLQQIAMDIKNILIHDQEQIFFIIGYTADIVGYGEDNDVLSKKRADRVHNILIDLGVPINNIVCITGGGTNKWGNNLTEETKKPNRVVTIVKK
jgi:outer membrane protein OmpA-like peptidoglycan-associated protein